MRHWRWLLALVVGLGVALRLVGLGQNPPGLYWDEVSLGWNAYSILKTGLDEHGRRLPLDTFFAFGDYKPPGYIYAAVPAIALLGLNELAVRLPSALAGTGLVVVTFFLTKELLSGKTSEVKSQKSKVSLVASFLLAISPWSVTLSRVAFESNLAVLFNALGVLFFLYAVNGKTSKVFKINLRGFLILSVVSFTAAAYTFNANRLLSPLFLIVLSLIYYKKALANWKIWGISAVLGILLILPMVGHLRSPEGGLRWREVNIFSDLKVIETSNDRRARAGGTLGAIGARWMHHRYVGYTRLFLTHYLDHFDLNYLFLDGDPNPRISVPDMGQLYLVELPFFIVGLISLLRPIGQIKVKERVVLLLWLLLAAVPAGLARETPHALRSASTLPGPQIVAAIGVIWVIREIGKIRGVWKKRLLVIGCWLLVAVSVAHFQLIYWRYYPEEWAGEWLTSYKRLVEYVRKVEGNYQTVYVTPDLGRPYVYFLFYSQYDPQKYIDEASAGARTGDAFGFFQVGSFGKYRFFVPDLTQVSPTELVVTRADPAPKGFESLELVEDTNGQSQFRVIRKR